MKIEDIKVCVLRIEGTNCEEESYLAFKRLSTKPEKVHLKQLLGIDVKKSEKRQLSDYQCLVLPGGFSSGDYIRAGAIFAARIKSGLKSDIIEFVKNGYPIIGICNGFQILVELGLLPGFKNSISEYPEAVLTVNDSSRFECRHTLLKHENNGNCIFTRKIKKNAVLTFPSAHAEGKFTFSKNKEREYLKKLIENDQIVFRYVDQNGEYAGYPWNPNGSLYNIAGICNPEGNVFGLMPHPERVFYGYTHLDWVRNKEVQNGDGRAVFESIVDFIKKKF